MDWLAQGSAAAVRSSVVDVATCAIRPANARRTHNRLVIAVTDGIGNNFRRTFGLAHRSARTASHAEKSDPQRKFITLLRSATIRRNGWTRRISLHCAAIVTGNATIGKDDLSDTDTSGHGRRWRCRMSKANDHKQNEPDAAGAKPQRSVKIFFGE